MKLWSPAHQWIVGKKPQNFLKAHKKREQQHQVEHIYWTTSCRPDTQRNKFISLIAWLQHKMTDHCIKGCPKHTFWPANPTQLHILINILLHDGQTLSLAVFSQKVHFDENNLKVRMIFCKTKSHQAVGEVSLWAACSSPQTGGGWSGAPACTGAHLERAELGSRRRKAPPALLCLPRKGRAAEQQHMSGGLPVLCTQKHKGTNTSLSHSL